MRNYKTRCRCLTSKLFQPKAVLIDLDGTVLPLDDRPTDVVINAISQSAQLIPTAIASGRVQQDVAHYARMFDLTVPQVADNGATLVDPLSGRIISSHILDKSEVENALTQLVKASDRVLVSDRGRIVWSPEEILDWQISIIMAKFETESEARSWADRLSSDTLTVLVSLDNKGDWYIDCTSPGIDKGSGLRDFAAQVGVEPDDVMVIGDGWNDIAMFEAAGFGVAMDTAPGQLLDLASDVVPGIDEDGVVTALERYVLS